LTGATYVQDFAGSKSPSNFDIQQLVASCRLTTRAALSAEKILTPEEEKVNQKALQFLKGYQHYSWAYKTDC
jgi:hypothetical protein